MLGLIVAALFAATMSVLSSGYNVMSAVLTLDVYHRWIRPHAEQKELVLVGRILTAAIGIVVLLIALAVSYYHWSIFDTMVAAFGFLLPPTVLPLLAGLLSRRLSSAGALAGFVAGLLIGGAMLGYGGVAHPPNADAFQAASILVPAVCTFLVLWGWAAWLPAKGEERDRAMRFIVGLSEPSRESRRYRCKPGPNCRCCDWHHGIRPCNCGRVAPGFRSRHFRSHGRNGRALFRHWHRNDFHALAWAIESAGESGDIIAMEGQSTGAKSQKLVLIADAGATHIRAMVAGIDGRSLGVGRSGTGNPFAIGHAAACHNLKAAVVAALKDARIRPARIAVVLVGSAGVTHDGRGAKPIVEDMRKYLKDTKIVVVGDGRIALAGALAGAPGVVAVSGTGSIVLGKDPAGRVLRVGGWGPLAGDEGSAQWIGRRAIQEAAHAADSVTSSTRLINSLCRYFRLRKFDRIIEAIYAHPMTPSELGALAPLVVRAADRGDGALRWESSWKARRPLPCKRLRLRVVCSCANRWCLIKDRCSPSHISEARSSGSCGCKFGELGSWRPLCLRLAARSSWRYSIAGFLLRPQ